MGQTESSSKADQTCKAPSSFIESRRQHSLNRLGVRGNKKRDKFISATSHEDDDLTWLESFAASETKAPISPKRGKQQQTGSFETTGPSAAPLRRQTSSTSSESNESEGMLEEMERLSPRDAFRLSFLRKLSDKKVLVPAEQRQPKHQTVTIFDWDDTLLCTSFLAQHEGQRLPPSIKQNLKDIEKAASRLLEKACQMGNTFIITNAAEGWVQFSASRYAPGLLPMLAKVRIISARSRYQAVYPHDVGKWKIHAFMDLQQELDLPVVTNLNSFGDANYEMEATRVMGKMFEEAFVKTVKFQESPTPQELLDELKCVERGFESVVENARNLKVSLEGRKRVPGSPM